MDEISASVRSNPLNTIGGTMALRRTQHPNATKSRLLDRFRRSRLLLTLLLAFRWMVTSNGFLFAVAVVVVGGSFALSFTTDAWHWFQRSGALLVSIGAILSTRHLLRVMLTAMLEERKPSETFASDRHALSDSDLATCFVGMWVVGLGTIIWAYGDLLGCLIGSSCL